MDTPVSTPAQDWPPYQWSLRRWSSTSTLEAFGVQSGLAPIIRDGNPSPSASGLPRLTLARLRLSFRLKWSRKLNKSKSTGIAGTVLIVDDNKDDVELARITLRKLFPQLCTQAVYSGEELIAYLQGDGGFADRREFPYPVLVFLDLRMPGMDGYDVLAWLRDRAPHHYIPVIVLTVVDEMQNITRAYVLGARSFLIKPLQAIDLANAVSGVQDWLDLIRGPELQEAH
jgi:CheY-like chemotaxis protein